MKKKKKREENYLGRGRESETDALGGKGKLRESELERGLRRGVGRRKGGERKRSKQGEKIVTRGWKEVEKKRSFLGGSGL